MDPMSQTPEILKAEILRLTRQYAKIAHGAMLPANDPARVTPELKTSMIPYAGRVFDADEVEAAVSSSLDFWLTLGAQGEAFEAELAAALGVRSSLLVNSGSSANLIALSALTTHKLPAHRRVRQGDEIITVAAGFPTTVSPIIQSGAIPVFIDNDPVTGNARVDQLEQAFVPGKTKAVMMAHTLGNPFDLGAVVQFCQRNELWLIEDNCDALGSTYEMPLARAKTLGFEPLFGPNSGPTFRASTGAWGDLSTKSFYPPHHITMGEGGAVNIVSKAALRLYAENFRDWGRDCWCASGKDDTCGRRFAWQLGELPEGYDHKYIYSCLGYNLKPLDLQAAIGRQQLKKFPAFVEARKRNWTLLRAGLNSLGEFFEFMLPTHATAWSPEGFFWDDSGCRTDCSWFGFMLRVKPHAPFSRTKLARYLDAQRIGNRMLFGGNLVRQPAFVHLRKERPEAFRVAAELDGADALMRQALFLGTYPGLTGEMINRMIEVIHEFVGQHA